MIDSSKFGQRALNRVLDTEQIDVLVTEKSLSKEDMDKLSDNNVEVIVVSGNN